MRCRCGYRSEVDVRKVRSIWFRGVGFTVFMILADASFGAVCGIAPIPPPVTGGAPLPFDVVNENMSSPKREDVSREVSNFGGAAEDMVPLLGDEGP